MPRILAHDWADKRDYRIYSNFIIVINKKRYRSNRRDKIKALFPLVVVVKNDAGECFFGTYSLAGRGMATIRHYALQSIMANRCHTPSRFELKTS